MTIASAIVLILLYFILVGILTLKGSKKKVGWMRMLVVSTFLTPLTGLLVYRYSEPVFVLKLTRYRCAKCGIDFTETMRNCPYCKRDGLITRLYPVVMRTL